MTSPSPGPGGGPSPLPSLCTDAGAKGANFVEGLGMAAVNIFGLGGLFGDLGAKTGLDNLKDLVNQTNQELQDFSNQATQIFAEKQATFDTLFVNSFETMQENTSAMINYNVEILQDEISSNSIYIATTFILALLLLFYMLSLPINKN